MDENPTKKQFDLQKKLLFMAVIFLILASALIIIKGYDLNKHLINVGLNQNKRAELIITKLEGRKIREAYYREKRYLVGQSMLPDKHLYLIDPYGDRKTALLVSAYELRLPEEIPDAIKAKWCNSPSTKSP
jgi:hypothetical protein